MIDVLLMGRKNVTCRCLDFFASSKSFNVVGVITDTHLFGSPTADRATALGINLYDYNSATGAILQGDLRFDLGISMLYWKKIKGTLLTHPPLGHINFHPAPLPEYKGTAGYNLAILEARSTWAVSAHYIDDSIDTGPIIEVAEFAIDSRGETAASLEAKSQDHLYRLFSKTVGRINKAQIRLDSAPNLGGRYISRAEMEAMKEVKLGDDVDRKIRAFWFPPYDGAYVIIGGSKYTLVNRFLLEKLAPPGETSLHTAATSQPKMSRS